MNWNSTFQTPQPPSSKANIILSQEELPFYQSLYSQLDPNNQGTVNGKQSVQFFKKSGLPVDVLKSIWIIASSNGSTLERDEFMSALRLVAYAQNGIEVSEKSIQQNIPVPLPRFVQDERPQIISTTSQILTASKQIQINPDSKLELPQEVFNKYNAYYSSIDTEQRGHIKGVEAKSLFSKSQLNNELLKQIWHLCDSGNKGYLYQGEFIIAIHLIALAKKGIEIPPILPDSLLNIMKQYRHQSQTQAQAVPSPRIQQQSNLLQQEQIQQQNQIELIAAEQKQQEQQLQQKIFNLNIQSAQVKKQSSNLEFQNALQSANDLIKSCVEEKSKDIDFFTNLMKTQEIVIVEAQQQTLQLKSQIQLLDQQRQDQFQQIQKLQQQLQNQLSVNQQLIQQLQQQASQQIIIAQVPNLEPIQHRPVSQPVGFQKQLEINDNHPKSFAESQSLNMQINPPLDQSLLQLQKQNHTPPQQFTLNIQQDQTQNSPSYMQNYPPLNSISQEYVINQSLPNCKKKYFQFIFSVNQSKQSSDLPW